MSLCALCFNDRELCRSHIYPRFTFARMKEDEGHFLKFSSNRTRPITLQDDCAEHLLCSECEGRLQRYEDYFARQMASGIFDKPLLSREEGHVVVSLDYALTKLFLLSLLWRVHAARSRQFCRISLGAKHGERIRQILSSENPGLPHDYGCMISVPFLAPEGQPRMRPRLSMLPFQVPFIGQVGVRMTRLHLDGVMFSFLVGSDECMARCSGAFLQLDGRMPIGVVDILNVVDLREALAETAAKRLA